MELIGGNVHCQSTLESINYSASLFKHDISKSISLFSQIINEPLFLPQEVEESKKTIDYENQSMRDTPEQRQEAFIHLAYSGKSLGVDTRITDNLTKESLDFFKNTHYTPNNMCIAGVGVDHDYLVDKINDSFGGMTRQALNIDSDMKTVYTGGLEIIDTTLEKVKNPDDQKLTHVYIGFEGLSMTDPDIYSLAVLASLFGGGGSFSAGTSIQPVPLRLKINRWSR